MHMLAIILGFLCGIVLSHRFKVLILAPMTLLGGLAIIAGEAIAPSSGVSTAPSLILFAIAMQVGYFGGMAFWRFLAANSLRRRHAAQPWLPNKAA
jgi:hypothetical protein